MSVLRNVKNFVAGLAFAIFAHVLWPPDRTQR